MCKYRVQIDSPYGVLNVKAESYQEGLDKYREIKEEYKNINCCIKFIKEGEDKPQFVKVNEEKSFDDLYSNLRKSVKDLLEYAVETSTYEKEMDKEYVKNYHIIEESDTSIMSEEEQLKLLFDLKVSLSKRRLSKLENEKNYKLHKYLKGITKCIKDYENKYNDRDYISASRYNGEYYTESIKEKKKRVMEFD